MKRRIRWAAPRRRKKVVEEYLKTKEEYENKARSEAIRSWKGFCEKQDREGMWEGVYRVIRCTGKRQEDPPLKVEGKMLDQRESAEILAGTFYPEDKTEEDNEEHQRTRELAEKVNAMDHTEGYDPPFTLVELQAAVNSFNPKKAPGADGLTADICKRAVDANPGLFLALTNKCLELGFFPTAWKEATVIVLRKPGKEDYTAAKAYRPIGLLPVLGKVLEKMIVGRLKWHLVPNMSPCQYGFMPQKSTEDALYALMQHIRHKIREKKIVVLVSLDIEGAFDSAWWPAIRVRLAEERCPPNIRRVLDSYLQDRGVRVRYAGEEVHRRTTKGCIQGSIGGPILWNLLLDPLLKGLSARGEYCQAFADDVALVFHGDTAMEIQGRADAALEYVRGWGVSNKLKFAPHKTCAMVLTNRLKYDTPHLTMGGIGIGMSREIRILGLVIDDKLTFNSHVAQTCRKALNVYKQLSRAARTSWGLHPEITRTIYTACVEPVIMYAAGVWAPAAKKLGVQKHLNVVQRGFAQRLCRAYRTVSLNAALALTGLLPLDLRIQEAAALYEAKRGVTRPAALADREVEQMAAYTTTPHPAHRAEIQFLGLETDEQLDHNNTQAVRIFTDGSKINGRVGAALSIWDQAAETGTRKFKLSSYCTVYQAEMLAIREATRGILKSSAHSYGIYSDSRSSLETIRNQSAVNPIAVEIRRNLADCKAQNKSVTLFWIKAHAGLPGNERADVLAKEAAEKAKTKPVYEACPISFVKRQIRKDTLGEWNRRYQSAETAKVTRVFLPDIEIAHKVSKCIKTDKVLTQVLTGHGGFSEYLHRFRCKEQPSCICDEEAGESILHLILECPVHTRRRYNLVQQLDTTLKHENICKIMANNKERKIFLDYCVEIAKVVIDRNKTN